MRAARMVRMGLAFAAVLALAAALAPTPALAASPVTVNLVPSQQRVDPGSIFDLQVQIATTVKMRGLTFSLSFDPTLLEVVSFEEGTFLSDWASTHSASTSVFPTPVSDNVAGTVSEANLFLLGGGTDGPSGNGVVWTYHMRAKADVSGSAVAELVGVRVADQFARVVTDVAVNNTSVEVRFLDTYLPLVWRGLSVSAASSESSMPASPVSWQGLLGVAPQEPQLFAR